MSLFSTHGHFSRFAHTGTFFMCTRHFFLPWSLSVYLAAIPFTFPAAQKFLFHLAIITISQDIHRKISINFEWMAMRLKRKHEISVSVCACVLMRVYGCASAFACVHIETAQNDNLLKIVRIEVWVVDGFDCYSCDFLVVRIYWKYVSRKWERDWNWLPYHQYRPFTTFGFVR